MPYVKQMYASSFQRHRPVLDDYYGLVKAVKASNGLVLKPDMNGILDLQPADLAGKNIENKFTKLNTFENLVCRHMTVLSDSHISAITVEDAVRVFRETDGVYRFLYKGSERINAGFMAFRRSYQAKAILSGVNQCHPD